MFYAKEILSMQAKTDISLIYYLSTTNNIRRINRKDILKLNIKNALINVLDQTFALRLYGYILKGVSKLYLLKIKYYEHEVTGLLNLLKVRLDKKRNIKKHSINDSSSSDVEDLYDGGLCSANIKPKQEIAIKDNMCMTDNSEMSLIPYLQSYNCDTLDFSIKLSKKLNFNIEDTEIELEPRNKEKRFRKSHSVYKFIDVKTYPIFSYVDRCTYKDSLEIQRNITTSNVPSQIISDTMSEVFYKYNNDDMYLETLNFSSKIETENGKKYNELSDNIIFSSSYKLDLCDLVGEKCFFSEIVFGTNRHKAIMFHELLDLLSKNVLEAFQDSPSSDILISKIY